VNAPAGVKQHRVSGLGSDAGPFDVFDGDDLAELEALNATHSGHVDHPSPRDDLRNRLGTQGA